MVSADFASFFSLATTFSLPGITTYSVRKSLSKSTPSDFFGKSLIWPSEASTSYPEPRYFWIVFAFAGDSTMTKPFANGTSILRNYVMKLARFHRKAKPGSRLLAVSCRLRHCGCLSYVGRPHSLMSCRTDLQTIH